MLVCFLCSQNRGKMFAMKKVKKKNPNLDKYAYTEQDILLKITHVSYRTLVEWENHENLPESFLQSQSSWAPSPSQYYLALCNTNLAYYSLETGQDMRFIVEKVRLLAHQLNWIEYRQGESRLILSFTCPHYTMWQTVLNSVEVPAVVQIQHRNYVKLRK